MEKVKKTNLDVIIKLSKTNNFNLVQQLNIRTYVPFAEKKEVIEMFMKDLFSNTDQLGKYNSLDKYLKFNMLVFKTYTNLQLDGTAEEYDKLLQSGLLDTIYSTIEEDYFDFKDFMEMRFEDYIRELYVKESKYNS